MATKHKNTTPEVEAREVETPDVREEVIASEPETSFDERTKDTQPWNQEDKDE